MKKLVLFSSLALSLAFIPFSNMTLAEKENLNAEVIAQSTEEPQSPSDFIDSIELTEEQKSEIQIILDEYRPEINSTFQERQIALENLNNIVKPNSSNNEIRIARMSFVHLNTKLSALLFEELMAVRDVLTMEQREQINQKLNELVSPNQPTP
jgi:Spy/CpxP family protein refolding chaperone